MKKMFLNPAKNDWKKVLTMHKIIHKSEKKQKQSLLVQKIISNKKIDEIQLYNIISLGIKDNFHCIAELLV